MSREGDQFMTIPDSGIHDFEVQEADKTSPHEAGRLLEARDAIQRLLETCEKLESVMARKLRRPFEKLDLLLREESTGEKLEKELQHLSQAAIVLIRIAKKRQKLLASLNETLRRFVRSDSVSEISTLIGLTALTDYSEYLSGISRMSKISNSTINPVMPRLMLLMDSSAELNKSSEWLHGILDFNEQTGEDDISRMIAAIRDLDLESFERIYVKLNKRIKAESEQQT